ncbi:aminotransferase class I/II-fold pyridoxal phosphate-dependent enzyme [Legionella resiliens]|uniref:Aminotransferase class I/II-fold pyridoxal phosphate-dependent enzyme n=1 Tax=Legionella resiliens TaxID=2905958 RepID=A0ABS8X5D7_9GAMM|nr:MULTISPECIES: aminotransferase class I/II-fold pyridoxal phosphate-dependent enzyme [unclassified Legionella]MCE0723337.1 aminotransferase class I/II-fold pyridoxal phosphate-dependent enzyme [Legionella sp. 9fVS26]MCE3532490.1 aminotransferase class I/II-fold pyridoxal phosphate-dependent enzyme [Legionella sp. 8cVS16]
MQDFISIVDALQGHVKEYPDCIAIKFLTQKNYETLTYKELDQQARRLAYILQQHESYYDERAVILLPPGLDYVVAFFACLYSGVIAVPVYPPRRNQHKNRVFSILEDSQAKFVITNQTLAAEFMEYTVIDIDSTRKEVVEKYRSFPVEQNKIAFLQYTSGSTNTPKGVLISHLNLVANIKGILSFTPSKETERDKVCSWLPPYHDMGLIGCVLTSIYKRFELILMPPAYFLHSPLRWLEIISQERITLTCVPNFAFDFCVKKITPAQIKQLDLSSLRCIYNGSEPIQFESVQQFINTFAITGLSPQTIYPCYGLAEATLMLTAKQYNAPDTSLKLIKSNFESGTISIAPESLNHSTMNIVNCGHCLSDHNIRIVDPHTLNELPESSIGEIWASGPSIAKGYWNKADLSKATFENQLPNTPDLFYLRTGDLGFIHQGNLYVTGRIKDLIIIHGKNYYPQDIEQAITQNQAAFEPQGAAAFAIEVDERQELIVVQEVKRVALNRVEFDLLFSEIRAVLLDQFGLVPYSIVLIKPYTLPKTSSGKIQRWLTRKSFLDKTLKNIAFWKKEDQNPTDGFSLTLSVKEVKQWLTDWLMRRLSMVLSEHDYDKSITALGINSIAAVELSNDLQTKIGKQIELLPLFEQYTLNQLIAFLAENIPAKDLKQIKNTQVIHSLVDKQFMHKSSVNGESFSLVDFPVSFGLGSLIQHSDTKLDNHFISDLKKIYFNVNEGISSNTTIIDGKHYINYSGYNYLGLSGEPSVTEAVIAAVKKLGTSVSASRLVSGEKSLHGELEKAIADLIGTEDCLVFPSGYSTNITVITHLFGKNDLIIHDELSHNSIIQAAVFSEAERIAFPHNNHQFLIDFLEKYRDQYRKVLIVTEGIFSMDGDIADVPDLITIKKQFNTFLMIDEAHSIGVLGETGKGIREHYNLDSKDVDIWMGTLSKAFASCGGYIAGSHELIENLRYTAAGFVYSAGISPANTAAALAAIEVMKKEPQRVSMLRDRHTLLLSLLKEQNIPTGLSNSTPIIPIVVGEDSAAIQLSHYLKENHILALPIIYPAVEKNLARVRLFMNCLHTEEQLYKTVSLLRNYVFFKNKVRKEHDANSKANPLSLEEQCV